jgi:hypothetical protein
MGVTEQALSWQKPSTQLVVASGHSALELQDTSHTAPPNAGSSTQMRGQPQGNGARQGTSASGLTAVEQAPTTAEVVDPLVVAPVVPLVLPEPVVEPLPLVVVAVELAVLVVPPPPPLEQPSASNPTAASADCNRLMQSGYFTTALPQDCARCFWTHLNRDYNGPFSRRRGR